ncbi:MAG TPA: hypothetical protein VGW74_14715 [Propionibacteriaceae bacterium]|nr:hypothetical protein [Propionibacteriaceae bacterium]
MPTDRRWSDTDRELVAGALAGRIRYSQHGQRCPVWTRAKGVEIGEDRAPTVTELARCDCWIMAKARRDGGAVLDAVTAAGWRREADVRAEVAKQISDWAGYGHGTDWEQGYRAAMHAAEIARTTPPTEES